MTGSAKRHVTYADLEAVPEHLVAEIIDGELMTLHHGAPRPAATRTALSVELRSFRSCRGEISGWQILMLPELHMGSRVIVPDLCGWRAETLPQLPEHHVAIAPDWVCEILSDETARRDRQTKRRLYGEVGVQHLWLIEPRQQLLEVFKNSAVEWTLMGTWVSDDEVRASPFDAISFSLAGLWPLDPPLGFNEDPTPYYAGDR
jgi:Uma2 family endonuclease